MELRIKIYKFDRNNSNGMSLDCFEKFESHQQLLNVLKPMKMPLCFIPIPNVHEKNIFNASCCFKFMFNFFFFLFVMFMSFFNTNYIFFKCKKKLAK